VSQSFISVNLRSLRRYYPAYADILSLVPNGSRYKFEPVGSVIGCRDPEGRWVHGPGDPWVEARGEAEQLVTDDAELFVVIRPGIGYQAFAILEAIERRASRSLVVVVEDRPDLFKCALHIADWTELLESAHAVLLLGNPSEVVEAFLESHPALAMLPSTIVAAEDMTTEAEYGKLRERIVALADKARTTFECQLGMAEAVLERRRARREPLRVALAGGDFGYLEAPIAEGFRACGCEVEASAAHRALECLSPSPLPVAGAIAGTQSSVAGAEAAVRCQGRGILATSSATSA
jgi:hypothetical protein